MCSLNTKTSLVLELPVQARSCMATKLTSEWHLQLAQISSYSFDTLPHFCFEHKIDRWSILTYCTFKCYFFVYFYIYGHLL